MRISDWSSDVCSSDLDWRMTTLILTFASISFFAFLPTTTASTLPLVEPRMRASTAAIHNLGIRSEEHTSELQSLMRISYAVFCLKNKTTPNMSNDSSTSEAIPSLDLFSTFNSTATSEFQN